MASVQASPGSPLGRVDALALLAEASRNEGVRCLRLEGVEAIRTIGEGVLVIGLVKRDYPGSSVRITATIREVEELIDTGCQVIAVDATTRPRPDGSTLQTLLGRIHRADRLAMADCDTLESAQHAIRLGFDIIGTTLSGYTDPTPKTAGPDFELVRAIRASGYEGLLLAEGRYATPQDVRLARLCGADAVVVGGALNDPLKQTRAFLNAARPAAEKVGAVDIGGTWLRFAVWPELEVVRIPLPLNPEDRLNWIREHVAESGVSRLGISSGGTIDPRTGEVWEAKSLIPGHVGTRFCAETLGVETVALNDGLATAWGFACRQEFAGKNLAVLALGTGVGCGFVVNHQLVMGPRGEYSRLNDVALPGGGTIEDALGGANLSDPAQALRACHFAIELAQNLALPDVTIVTGGVTHAPWFKLPDKPNVVLQNEPTEGLFGAASLAQWPPFEWVP